MFKKAFIIVTAAVLVAGCGPTGSNDTGGTGTDTRSSSGSSENGGTSPQNAPSPAKPSLPGTNSVVNTNSP